MVVKFFKKPAGGGGVGSIKYLLNDRVTEGTARILAGNEKLTTSIIESIKRKDKATVGCISFEEKNINEELKYKLMSDLEKTLFPGMDKSQYNILWVEHTDKNRLELNFVIPKVELTTNKLLTPYYHKQDLPRLENFEKLNNLKYNFSHPLDPIKARNIQDANTKEQLLYGTYEEFDSHIKAKVKSGELANREELISYVKKEGHAVTRINKNGFSIKLKDSKKARRFKDDMYSERFVSLESINIMKVEKDQASKEFNEDLKDNKDELIKKYSDKLAELNQYKGLIFAEKYTPLIVREPKIIIQKVRKQNENNGRADVSEATKRPSIESEIDKRRERIRRANQFSRAIRNEEIARTRTKVFKRARAVEDERIIRNQEHIQEVHARTRADNQQIHERTRTFRERIKSTLSNVKNYILNKIEKAILPTIEDEKIYQEAERFNKENIHILDELALEVDTPTIEEKEINEKRKTNHRTLK